MIDTLPFEYGFMYKLVDGKCFLTSWVSPNQNTYNSQDNYNSYSGGSFLSSFSPLIDGTFNFFPMSFSEKNQKVTGEVIASEQRQYMNMVPQGSNYGLSFTTNNSTEHSKRPLRIEVDVNEFIRDFEKIL